VAQAKEMGSNPAKYFALVVVFLVSNRKLCFQRLWTGCQVHHKKLKKCQEWYAGRTKQKWVVLQDIMEQHATLNIL